MQGNALEAICAFIQLCINLNTAHAFKAFFAFEVINRRFAIIPLVKNISLLLDAIYSFNILRSQSVLLQLALLKHSSKQRLFKLRHINRFIHVIFDIGYAAGYRLHAFGCHLFFRYI